MGRMVTCYILGGNNGEEGNELLPRDGRLGGINGEEGNELLPRGGLGGNNEEEGNV